MGYDLYPMETLEFKRAFLREAIDHEYLCSSSTIPSWRRGIIREDERQTIRGGGVWSRRCSVDASASSAAVACTTWRS